LGVHRGEDIIVWVKMALAHGMAHAAHVSAIYDRSAVCRASVASTKEPPGSLVYLAELILRGQLPELPRQGVRRLFDRIAFFTSAGMREAGDWAGMKAIRKLVLRSGFLNLQLVLWCLRLIPAGLLTYARRFRQR